MINFRHVSNKLTTLWTVPSAIALSIGLSAFALVYLDRLLDPLSVIVGTDIFTAPTARGMLSIIAGGAMTALSLAYSLVLVVFTLAAANIGPRLLKRFTTDPVNQVTAGLLGGTFLYCVVVLLFVAPEDVPQTAVFGSGLLGLIMVMQLIYFVRKVSRNVTIDDEIAAISQRLAYALAKRYETPDNREEDEDFSKTLDHEHETREAGYIGHIDEDLIIKTAADNECVVRLEKSSGGFLVKGEILFSTSRAIDEDTASQIYDAITLEPSRSTDSEIEFSINLLVEIALRALSPGVNDTFTALACVDSFSNAFAKIADARTAPSISHDEDGETRLVIPDLSVIHMFSMTFNPLRRASRNNIMMYQALAKAYTRLFIIGSRPIRRLAKNHTELLMQQLDQEPLLDIDKESVTDLLITPLRKDAN